VDGLMIIDEIDILVAERGTYNRKLFYWEKQKRKAEKYISKYNNTIAEIEKNIKNKNRKEQNDTK